MMSGPERPPELSVPTTKLKRKYLADEDQEELEQLETIFKRIKKAVPRAPYILSTPSLHPYQYHSRHEAQAWMMGHLFKPDEEHLQYRTFHFREPYQDCFTLQHGEDDEPELQRPKSQASNVSNQAPKKKISLSDYKSKQANGVITPGSKKVSPVLQPSTPTSAQTNGVKPVTKRPNPAAQKQDEAKPQKRFVGPPFDFDVTNRSVDLRLRLYCQKNQKSALEKRDRWPRTSQLRKLNLLNLRSTWTSLVPQALHRTVSRHCYHQSTNP